VDIEPLGHVLVAAGTQGIWRVRDGDRTAVVKVLAHAPDYQGNWPSGVAEDDWGYWRREALAYSSGLLASLGGRLRAPSCIVEEQDDGSVALWLEDLSDRGVPAPTWELSRYGDAARHLGRAQGEFVVAGGRPLPTDRWLSRGWLRTYLTRRDADMSLLTDPMAWRHPLVAAGFPDPPVDELVAMRADQERFLAVLDGMPPTLAHLDCHPANLFDVDGDTVVIDWGFVGIGALGEDPGNLVPDSVLDFHVGAEHLDLLYETVASGYHAGLRDAGWSGSADDVRRAMAAAMAAKYAWIAPGILRATSEGRDRMNGRPIAEALAAWAPTVRFLLARADEARGAS
jgi:hypothetical protein